MTYNENNVTEVTRTVEGEEQSRSCGCVWLRWVPIVPSQKEILEEIESIQRRYDEIVKRTKNM